MHGRSRKINFNYCLIFIFSLLSNSCTKFVQIPPPKNQLVSANVFTSNGSATSAVTGLYTTMAQGGFASGGFNSVTLLSGLSADEFTNSSTNSDIMAFANNSLTITNGSVLSIWTGPYNFIYAANSIMEGLSAASGVTDSVRKQLIGEAKFVRAFSYFYLTNLFGDVPLYLTSNYQVNETSVRTPADQVYNQIVLDLLDAQNSLAGDYSFSKGERIRPNKWVATAMLARVYLYEKKYDSAELEATAVINNDLYSLETDLNKVFLANSSEAIWQLLPVNPNINTWEGFNFILTAPPTIVSLSPFVTGAFETGDQRMTNWVGTFTDGVNTWYFPYKYKVQASTSLTEYSMVFRLAEQYLIRSEARANQNKISGAQDDLNAIRTRAGLGNTPANDLSSVTSAIEHERQVELFSEWGHRWLDLSRTNRANAVLGTEKLGWQATDILYPIPATELQNNPRITQNAGY